MKGASPFFKGTRSVNDSSGGNINNSGELEMLSQTAWAAHKHLVDSAEKAAAAAATGKASSTYSSLSSLPIYPWPVGSVDSTWCALQRRSFRRFALLRRLYRDMATVQRTLRAIERLVVASPSPLAQSNDNKYNNDDDGDKDDDGGSGVVSMTVKTAATAATAVNQKNNMANMGVDELLGDGPLALVGAGYHRALALEVRQDGQLVPERQHLPGQRSLEQRERTPGRRRLQLLPIVRESSFVVDARMLQGEHDGRSARPELEVRDLH